MPEIKDLVSLSSRMMAAVRAIETQRPDALFKDPLTVKLAGDELIAVDRSEVLQYKTSVYLLIHIAILFNLTDFLLP